MYLAGDLGLVSVTAQHTGNSVTVYLYLLYTISKKQQKEKKSSK